MRALAPHVTASTLPARDCHGRQELRGRKAGAGYDRVHGMVLPIGRLDAIGRDAADALGDQVHVGLDHGGQVLIDSKMRLQPMG